MSVMEKRNTTIILLFVIGIIGIYSYPQSLDEGIALQEGERIKREAKPQRIPHKDDEVEDQHKQDEGNQEPNDLAEAEFRRVLAQQALAQLNARIAELQRQGIDTEDAQHMAREEVVQQGAMRVRVRELVQQGISQEEAERRALQENNRLRELNARIAELEMYGMDHAHAEQRARQEFDRAERLRTRTAELQAQGMSYVQARTMATDELNRGQG